MEKNIFKGAKFSDKFITRDGTIAAYLFSNQGYNYVYHNLVLNKFKCIESLELQYIVVDEHGLCSDEKLCDTDIVSRYQESVAENKLDRLKMVNEQIDKLMEEREELRSDIYNELDKEE